MEHQKIIHLFDNTPSQPSKQRIKQWCEINDGSRGTCNTNIRIKFKTPRLKSTLCDYSYTYIILKDSITAIRAPSTADAAAKQAEEINKIVKCATCIASISKINHTQVINAKDLDVVILMYDFVEYSDNYSKASGSLWQYYRDQPDDTIINSQSLKSNRKLKQQYH